MPAPRKSPVGAIVFWFVTVCAVAALSNFKGRYTGWANRLAGGETPEHQDPATTTIATNTGGGAATTQPTSQGRTDTARVQQIQGAVTEIVDETGTVKDVYPKGKFKAVEVAESAETRSDAEKEFDGLYKKYLSRLTPPKVGQNYTFRLTKGGGEVSGVLQNLSPGAVSVRTEYGAITYPIHRIHESSQAKLFPQRAAKMAALRELNQKRLATERAAAQKQAEAEARAAREREAQIAAARAAENTASRPPEPTPQAKPTTIAQMPPQPVRPDVPKLPPARGDLNYDTSPGKTPEHLKGPLTGFANWLQVQQRRMGGKIANKVYAKQPDRGRIVLYLHMHENFMVQDYDWRFQISEGIWRIWALRGVDSGLINGPNHGHVVLIDSNNRIIGGSSPDDGSNVWAERNL